MQLPDKVRQAIKRAGVTVYFVDRAQLRIWRKARLPGELAMFGGWYWHREQKGRVTDTDSEGPFRCQSAAMRDAYVKLQLGR